MPPQHRWRAALARIRSASLLVALAPFTGAQIIEVPLDDPRLVYSEYVTALISAGRVHFERSPFTGPYWDQSPGSRLSLRTDALRVEVRVDYLDACLVPGCALFGLEVDGALEGPVGADQVLGEWWVTLHEQAQPKMRELSLIWPFATRVDLTGLRLTGGSADLGPPPQRPPLLFAAYGDSITHGFGASSIAQTFPYVVGDLRGWSVLNLGFGSLVIMPGDGAPLGALGADIYSVEVGTNDYKHDTDPVAFGQRYHTFLDGLRATLPEVPVVLITPTWVSYEGVPNAWGVALEDYRQAIRDVVAERSDGNLLLIEGWDMAPGDLLHFPDGSHLGDLGLASFGKSLAVLNRVPNGSFEHASYLWDDWGNIVQDPDEAVDGLFALRVGPGAGGSGLVVHGLEPNRCLRLGAWCRVGTPVETGILRIRFLDGLGAEVAEHGFNVDWATWQWAELPFVTPPAFARAELLVEKGAGSDDLWVDGLRIVLDDPGIAAPYGCGVNPPNSLSLLAGSPTPGDTMTFGLNDPEGVLTPGVSIPFVAIAQAPDPAFPCGTLVAGWGPEGEVSELLVPLTPPLLLGPILSGPAWLGSQTPCEIQLDVPLSCSLIGNVLYAQGVLVDPAFPGGGAMRVTNGLELRFGG